MPTTPAASSSNKPAAPGKSCAACPSLFNVSQQGRGLGRSIGGPVCALKMIPLARPGGPEKKTMEHFANNCDSYGKEVTVRDEAKTRPITFAVALPTPGLRKSDDPGNERVYSCSGCTNYLSPPTVRKLTGWSAGYCQAKGQLLLDDRLDRYADGCEDKVKRNAGSDLRPQAVNIMLFPEYSMDFGKRKKPDLYAIHKMNIDIDPREYPSDVPITPAHERLGIRAFRRLADPKGYGKSIFLPIMNDEIFEKEDRDRIPTSGDPERPEHYFDHGGAIYKIAAMWTKLKETPALWGSAGVGKTELARHMAWMMRLPFQRISITESSEVDDLIGKMRFEGGETKFQYGRVTRGWQRPNVLCLDEPNTGQPAVWQALRPLTDDSRQLVIDQNNGERIPAHRLCYLIMAMNPAWDPRNTGVFPLADADGSRLMHIWMDLPPEDIERKILMEALMLDGWEEKAAELSVGEAMRIAKDIRALSAQGTIPVSWGIRSQKKVTRARRYMSWTDSFRMGVTDSLEPQVAETILEVVKSYSDEED